MQHTAPISLTELAPNDRATIVRLPVGRAEITRLASLGFTPGAKVNMNYNYGKGPLIVIVRGARVALGRDEAAQIVVERRIE